MIWEVWWEFLTEKEDDDWMKRKRFNKPHAKKIIKNFFVYGFNKDFCFVIFLEWNEIRSDWIKEPIYSENWYFQSMTTKTTHSLWAVIMFGSTILEGNLEISCLLRFKVVAINFSHYMIN
jgi:hypothetical protein